MNTAPVTQPSVQPSIAGAPLAGAGVAADAGGAQSAFAGALHDAGTKPSRKSAGSKRPAAASSGVGLPPAGNPPPPVPPSLPQATVILVPVAQGGMPAGQAGFKPDRVIGSTSAVTAPATVPATVPAPVLATAPASARAGAREGAVAREIPGAHVLPDVPSVTQGSSGSHEKAAASGDAASAAAASAAAASAAATPSASETSAAAPAGSAQKVAETPLGPVLSNRPSPAAAAAASSVVKPRVAAAAGPPSADYPEADVAAAATAATVGDAAQPSLNAKVAVAADGIASQADTAAAAGPATATSTAAAAATAQTDVVRPFSRGTAKGDDSYDSNTSVAALAAGSADGTPTPAGPSSAKYSAADGIASLGPATAAVADGDKRPHAGFDPAILGGNTGAAASVSQPIANPSPGAPAEATPAPSLRIHASVDSADFPQGLSDRVSWMVDNGVNGAKLQINPPQLGPIELRISVQGDHAQVWMTTHSAVARDALESSSPKLRDMLGAQGFGQVSVDISQRSFHDRSPQAQPYERETPGRGESATAAVATIAASAPRAPLGALDAYA